MSKLLKEMPEHAERVEKNYSLIGRIEDEIGQNAEFSELHSSRETHIENIKAVAEKVLDAVSEFVNENYIWKGELAR